MNSTVRVTKGSARIMLIHRFLQRLDQAARSERMYARSTEKLKVNLTAYNRQKEAALGLPAGTLAPVAASSDALAAPSSSAVAGGDAYGSANSLSYAKERPDDDAIDNVVRDMNEK